MLVKSKEIGFYLVFIDLSSYVIFFRIFEMLKIVYEFLEVWRL